MAMADTEEKPGTAERYLAATEAGNLVLLDHRSGAADLLIAAGLSEENVGTALARLVGEWDSAAKPKRAAEAQIKAVAEGFRRDDEQARLRYGPPNPKAPRPANVLVRARAEALAWYARELRLFAQGLRSRAECVEYVRQWSAIKGLDQGYAGAALYHWLDPNCPVCQGRGMIKPPDAPAHTRACNACSATGRTVLSDQAFRTKDWLDGCLSRAERATSGNRDAVKAAKRWIAEKR
jgi:hypothetical protein